jgi:hypothetical protein
MSNAKEIIGTVLGIISLTFTVIEISQRSNQTRSDEPTENTEERNRKKRKAEQAALDFEKAIKRIEAKERQDSITKDSLKKAELVKMHKAEKN